MPWRETKTGWIRLFGTLDILCSANSLGVAGPDADQVSNLLTLMRKMYCRVVVDLARPCQFSLGLVHRLDELPLVTSNSVSALYKAKRTIETPREKAPRMAGSG